MVKCILIDSQMMLDQYAQWWVVIKIKDIFKLLLSFNSYCRRSLVKDYAAVVEMC